MISIWTVLKVWFAWVVLGPFVGILVLVTLILLWYGIQEFFKKKHK